MDVTVSFADMSLVGVNPLDVVPFTRDLAEMCNVPLSDEPTAAQLDNLVKVFGPSRAFDNNVPSIAELLGAVDDLPPQEAMSYIKGGALPLLTEFGPRNIFGDKLPLGAEVLAWITAGTANWSQRRVDLLSRLNKQYVPGKLVASGSRRPCTLPSEGHVSNKTTEVDYLFNLLDRDVDRLWNYNGHPFDDGVSMATQVENVVVQNNFASLNRLSECTILVPVNAGALNVPLEMITVFARTVPGFDPAKLFFAQDGIDLAENQEQIDDRAHYQRPLTLLSAWARLVKALYDLNKLPFRR